MASSSGVSIICIAGGSAAGKTTFSRALQTHFGDPKASLTALDWFYRDISHWSSAAREAHNFDHPSAIDHDYFRDCLASLVAGQSIERPVYSYADQSRTFDGRKVEPAPYLIIEGIHALALPYLRAKSRLNIYVDAPVDIKFARRLARDSSARGLSEELIRRQFYSFVIPMEKRFLVASRRFAHHIVDGTADTSADIAAITAMLTGRP